LIGVAGGESASVDVDLVVYEFEVFLYLGELGGHVGAVGLHEGKSFLLVAVPGGYQLGVAADRLDGHPGGPQLGADGDPLQVELLVAAPSSVVAVDAGDAQAGPFVVAQGVHADPRAASSLGELRLFRSVPFSSAIAMALFALCGFSAFLFVTTQYLQDVRGLSALTAGLCLLPVGGMVLVLSPLTGRVVGGRGPRLPLVVAGTALALGGGASIWLGPTTPLPAVLAIYLLFGIFLGTVNPPITNTAVSGMPTSMAGVAASLASTGRQTGTTLGVAISGTIVGSALARGGTAYTSAEHSVWWLILGLGVGILILALLSTGRWALDTAARAAAQFEEVDRGADPRTASPRRTAVR